MSSPTCIPFNRIGDRSVGGKAGGLARLVRDGFAVPEGFVIIGATENHVPPDLEAHYSSIGGGRVAVRSSASGEDSADASFAGQYETILDVEGVDALHEAVFQCVRSERSARASRYRDAQGGPSQVTMNVVVQRMVNARAAGVLFTVDPVTARRDRVVVDAVKGLGEALVSGEATPDHWLVDRAGLVVHHETQGSDPVLSAEEVDALIADGLRAEAVQRRPLDMEWAIDEVGKVWWLQARPITQLPADPNELDTPGASGAVYTWANIGEMMPGAVTPLTFSVTARGIDIGMQRMYRHIGSNVPEEEGLRYVAMFFGHLFLNLRTLAELAADVAGSTKEQMCMALCGRDVSEVEEPEPAPSWKRALNGARYARMLLSVRKHGDALDTLRDSLTLPTANDAAAIYQEIDGTLPAVWRAYELHLMSSAAAGALSPILLGIVAKGGEPTSDHHAEVAEMLAGATEVESADIADGAERILDELVALPDSSVNFAEASSNDALEWLRSAGSGTAGAEFARYLNRHGHRAVRELELRQKGWAVDPAPVIASLQSGLRAKLANPSPPNPAARRAGTTSKKHPFLTRGIPLAHAAVRHREHTKSGLVAVTTHFKHAYRQLGSAMVREGLLTDDDAVFFLTHEELGRLVSGETHLGSVATDRRKTTEYQMHLRFPEVFTGHPEPLPTKIDPSGDAVLTGRPVSRGVVIGRARVALTLDDASALEAGEILIAPITDVGWTPYFNLIAGLATDVGSAVSHGAVVAREYGLPAVVNLGTATTSFKTGDMVALDGDRGTLSLARE